MLLQCPSCGHSAEVEDARIPEGRVKAVCPACEHRFVFTKQTSIEGFAGRHLENPPYLDSLRGEQAHGLAQHAAPKFSLTSPAEGGANIPPDASSGKKAGARPAGLLQHRLTFHGQGGSLFVIYLKNMFLSLITLNIYYFWGKTRVRQYLYSQMELLGERFTYLGTGKELFRGAYKAGGIFLVAFVVPNLLSQFVHQAFGILILISIFLLRPFVMVAARRYRYSRTEWHGVRFSFRGSIKEGMKLFISGSFLSVITLGFYYPRYYIQKQAFFREHAFFGTAAFKYTGESKDVFKRMLFGLFLSFITLGIYWFWYKAYLMRYDWEHTSIQSVRFGSEITGGKLLRYHLGNALLLILTMGIGYAWFVKRKTEFWAKYIHMTGEFDFNAIRQTANDAKASGDDLASMMDIDFAF